MYIIYHTGYNPSHHFSLWSLIISSISFLFHLKLYTLFFFKMISSNINVEWALNHLRVKEEILVIFNQLVFFFCSMVALFFDSFGSIIKFSNIIRITTIIFMHSGEIVWICCKILLIFWMWKGITFLHVNVMKAICLSTSLKGIIWRQLTDASVYCTLMKFGKYVYEMIFLFVLLIKSRLGEGEGNQKWKVSRLR